MFRTMVPAMYPSALWDPNSLSSQSQAIWGKSGQGGLEWMPLWRHLADSAAVAGLLWDEWLPASVRSVIRAGRLSEEEGRTILIWLAGSHDLGKATPAFAYQVPALADRLRDSGFHFDIDLAQFHLPHSTLSHAILRDWLVERHGFAKDAASGLAIIPGGHHGVAPVRFQTMGPASNTHHRGDELWRRAQRELADWVADSTGVEAVLRALDGVPPPVPAQVLLTAVVIVADWIASDSDRFPYLEEIDPATRAERGWDGLRLPPPWEPNAPGDIPSLFRDRFGIADPRPVQRGMMDLVAGMDHPGLVILEAPMGEGKTEAALAAAEVLATRFGCGGLYLGLPTMATSDAMFGRVRSWLDAMAPGPVSVFLAHGKAALNKDFQDLIHIGRVAGIGDEDGSDHDQCGQGVAMAMEWLSGRKKGMLASFVVGTVDQLLMSTLHLKHVALRHLSLAGKVVVVDEVHSSDEYMGVFLNAALHWLAAYRVPVVLLSATLSGDRRQRLIDAYASGWRKADAVGFTADTAEHYPVITAVTPNGVSVVGSDASGRSADVEVVLGHDRDVVALVQEALVDGGCVGIIRNTVQRAQETAEALRAEFGDDVFLTHSRYLAVDRMRREDQLRAMLGPSNAGRPERLVVVGTQVLEQSLDIDFDLLITDLAPVDLILQRMGRLHRHQRSEQSRGRMREPRCVIVGVDDWVASPIAPVKGSTYVYGAARLLRAGSVLLRVEADGGVIHLPRDIPRLVDEAALVDMSMPEGWEETYSIATNEERQDLAGLRRHASNWCIGKVGKDLFDWNTGSDSETAQGQARVRDGDDSIEVLVAQQIDDQRRILPWIHPHGGVGLSLDAPPEARFARALATCSLRLPAWLCNSRGDQVVKELEALGRAAWQQSPWLRGQLVLLLDENLETELAGVRIVYSSEEGLRVSGNGSS